MLRQAPQSTSERRQELRLVPNCHFTDRHQFCALLTSRGRMARFNDDTAAVRGIVDLDSGERYVIEVEKLFPAEITSSSYLW
jgi:hypothetical protein